MKKFVLVLIMGLATLFVQAQDSHVGFSAKGAYLTQLGFADVSTLNLSLGAHFATQAIEPIEFRVGAEIIVAGWPGLSANIASLYRIGINEKSTAYLGLGLDAGLGLSGDFGAPLAGIHGILGFEYKEGTMGYFAELQPFYYAFELTGITAKVGSNIYF